MNKLTKILSPFFTDQISMERFADFLQDQIEALVEYKKDHIELKKHFEICKSMGMELTWGGEFQLELIKLFTTKDETLSSMEDKLCSDDELIKSLVQKWSA
jgi:hypothetical protein